MLWYSISEYCVVPSSSVILVYRISSEKRNDSVVFYINIAYYYYYSENCIFEYFSLFFLTLQILLQRSWCHFTGVVEYTILLPIAHGSFMKHKKGEHFWLKILIKLYVKSCSPLRLVYISKGPCVFFPTFIMMLFFSSSCVMYDVHIQLVHERNILQLAMIFHFFPNDFYVDEQMISPVWNIQNISKVNGFTIRWHSEFFYYWGT